MCIYMCMCRFKQLTSSIFLYHSPYFSQDSKLFITSFLKRGIKMFIVYCIYKDQLQEKKNTLGLRHFDVARLFLRKYRLLIQDIISTLPTPSSSSFCLLPLKLVASSYCYMCVLICPCMSLCQSGPLGLDNQLGAYLWKRILSQQPWPMLFIKVCLQNCFYPCWHAHCYVIMKVMFSNHVFEISLVQFSYHI